MNNHIPAGCTAVLVCIALLMLSSCSPETETADLYVQIEDRYASLNTASSRSLDLSVSYYLVTGRGPDGNRFELTSETGQITVPGLVLGDWEITVIGFSAEEKGLSQGQTIITLTKAEYDGTIIIDQFYGTGSAVVTASWDDAQVVNAGLSAQISLSGSVDPPQQLTADSTSAGTAVYNLNDYPAGAYLLQMGLYSEGILTAGAAKIIRIVDGETSLTDISLTFNDLLVGMQLTLHDSYSEPLSGSITGIPLTALTGSPVTVAFTPDPECSFEEISCMWYVDGELFTTGNPIEYIPQEGIQRLDVIATTSDSGSDASAVHVVEGVSGIQPGTPLLYRNYAPENEKGIKVDGISDIQTLPDGTIAVVSAIDDCLQLLSIQNDELYLEQTFTSDGLAMLDGASRLEVSEDGRFIAVLSDNDQSITIFEYDPVMMSADHFQTLLSAGGSTVTYDIGQLGAAAFTDDGATLMVTDRSDNSFIQFSLQENMYACTGSFTFTEVLEVSDPRSMTFMFNDYTAVVASTGTNALFFMEGASTDQPLMKTFRDYVHTSTSGLSAVHTIERINENQFIALAQDTLSEFFMEGTTQYYSITQDSRHKESTHVPVPFRPKDATHDSAGDIVYAVTTSGNGITVFTRDPISGSLAYDSFVSTDSVSPDSCEASIDDQYLLAGASADDRLLLYKIAQ